MASGHEFPHHDSGRHRTLLKVADVHASPLPPLTAGRAQLFHFEWEIVRATAVSVSSFFPRIMTRRSQVISELGMLDGGLPRCTLPAVSATAEDRDDEDDVWLARWKRFVESHFSMKEISLIFNTKY